jgi:5-methylcytosine-specific restriction enzyme B
MKGVSPVSYRLYESVGYLAPYAAFAESSDFDALRLWAVDHNDWKGTQTAAVIVSDEGRVWYVSRSGNAREANAVQATKLIARLEGHHSTESATQLGYEVPPPERSQHKTVPVSAKTSLPTELPQKHGVWIFQASPQQGDLLGFLRQPSTQPGVVDSWVLRQHADDVSDGDTVLLWTAGKQAGIYATGTIAGQSYMRDREEWEPENAPSASRAIRYRLDDILLDCPVLRRDLVNDPILKDLSVIRQSQGTNFPVTVQQWEALRPLIESPSGAQATPLPPPQRFDPSDDLEWLLRETLWSRAEVEDVLDTLRTRRPQIILAGPPGTGKTWVAERIGRFLTGGQPDAVHIVQFHPSYAYEDFVEGLRPVARDGQVAFEVVSGALVKVADHARRVDHPVVLVIDEMNRANLPSVFGELLYLLEYRDKEIRLLHRDRFSLPPNLYVIGTMNTADRSIRSVDTALRRRFDIFECPPRPDTLDAYYRSGGNNSEVFGLAEGLRKLNDRLTQHLDHHHTVGHSFFMARNFTQNDLRRTWLRQIRPLIDEYFFDQPDLVQQFDLTMFWPSLPSL